MENIDDTYRKTATQLPLDRYQAAAHLREAITFLRLALFVIKAAHEDLRAWADGK